MKAQDLTPEERVGALAASAAAYELLSGDEALPANPEEVTGEGKAFVIDVVIPAGLESGDGRQLLPGSLSVRDLPIALLWQPKTGSGHDGSYVVGRIDSVDVAEDGLKNARGVFDTGPYGREAQRLVENGFLRGISADLDKFEVLEGDELESYAALAEAAGSPLDTTNKLFVKAARAMAATLLPKPAFQECTIRIDEGGEAAAEEEIPVLDGTHEAERPASELAEDAESALIASAIPVEPPAEWFDNPRLAGETALTVTPEGRVYGHVATWSQDHVGFNYSVKPPRSRSGYAYFHTGLVTTAERTEVPVGQLTLAGGHAPLDASAAKAVEHYDNTGSAIADVHAGEDRYGIWVSGALRPDATPERVRAFKASAPSGDWRPINGRLEMVGVCQVNVPGFPVPRARVASGACVALVAAGTQSLYGGRHEPAEPAAVTELAARVQLLEQMELRREREAAIEAMRPLREERRQALVAAADAARSVLAPDLEPAPAQAADDTDLRARYEAAKAAVGELALGFKEPWDESEHPRDGDGRWRQVLGRLSDVLKGENGHGATEALEKAAQAEESGDPEAAADAGREARAALKEAVGDSDAPEDVVEAAKEAVAEVEEALPETPDSAEAPAGDGGGGDIIDDAIEAVLEELIDELGESVDPQSLADRAVAQLKHLVDDSAVEPEELAKLVADKVEKKLTPDIAQ